MPIYQCTLTLHDNVFFATREMGILYETEKYLHNWALSYALFAGIHVMQSYRLVGPDAQRPSYLDPTSEQNLLPLNKEGIYVFPAKPLQWSYQVHTFKAAQVHYYAEAVKFGDCTGNFPINYGRAKELAVGSIYQTYILAPETVQIPRWIRLGKWAAKVHVQIQTIAEVESGSGRYICTHPLNPLDLPPATRLLLYNRIVMPPSSLVSHAQLEGDYWLIEKRTYLPRGVAYGANYPQIHSPTCPSH